MGDIITAACECGYIKSEMLLGGGEFDPIVYCLIPHYCESCITLFKTDYFDKNKICPECKSTKIVSYFDKKLNNNGEGRAFHRYVPAKPSVDIELTRTNNLCPACGKFTMTFWNEGCWD